MPRESKATGTEAGVRGGRTGIETGRAFRSARLAVALAAVHVSIAALSGCNSTMNLAAPGMGALGGEGSTFANGRGTRGFSAGPEETKAAALEAMEDLRMTRIGESVEGNVVKLTGVTADQRPARVEIESRPGFTRVSARLGVVGDRMLTRTFLDRMELHLRDARPGPGAGAETGVGAGPRDAEIRQTGAGASVIDRDWRGEGFGNRGSDAETSADRDRDRDREPPGAFRRFSRDAVSDEVMLRNQFDSGYLDSAAPRN